MTIRSRKFRGRRTHGRGVKAGRGKGKRGGSGNAGGHKHRWIATVKYVPGHYGVHGFKRPVTAGRGVKSINVGDIERMFPTRVGKGDLSGKEVDLEAAGIQKLLGSGRISVPVVIRVARASPRARAKVEAAGGKVIQPE